MSSTREISDGRVSEPCGRSEDDTAMRMDEGGEGGCGGAGAAGAASGRCGGVDPGVGEGMFEADGKIHLVGFERFLDPLEVLALTNKIQGIKAYDDDAIVLLRAKLFHVFKPQELAAFLRNAAFVNHEGIEQIVKEALLYRQNDGRVGILIVNDSYSLVCFTGYVDFLDALVIGIKPAVRAKILKHSLLNPAKPVEKAKKKSPAKLPQLASTPVVASGGEDVGEGHALVCENNFDFEVEAIELPLFKRFVSHLEIKKEISDCFRSKYKAMDKYAMEFMKRVVGEPLTDWMMCPFLNGASAIYDGVGSKVECSVLYENSNDEIGIVYLTGQKLHHVPKLYMLPDEKLTPNPIIRQAAFRKEMEKIPWVFEKTAPGPRDIQEFSDFVSKLKSSTPKDLIFHGATAPDFDFLPMSIEPFLMFILKFSILVASKDLECKVMDIDKPRPVPNYEERFTELLQMFYGRHPESPAESAEGGGAADRAVARRAPRLAPNAAAVCNALLFGVYGLLSEITKNGPSAVKSRDLQDDGERFYFHAQVCEHGLGIHKTSFPLIEFLWRKTFRLFTVGCDVSKNVWSWCKLPRIRRHVTDDGQDEEAQRSSGAKGKKKAKKKRADDDEDEYDPDGEGDDDEEDEDGSDCDTEGDCSSTIRRFSRDMKKFMNSVFDVASYLNAVMVETMIKNLKFSLRCKIASDFELADEDLWIPKYSLSIALYDFMQNAALDYGLESLYSSKFMPVVLLSLGSHQRFHGFIELIDPHNGLMQTYPENVLYLEHHGPPFERNMFVESIGFLKTTQAVVMPDSAVLFDFFLDMATDEEKKDPISIVRRVMARMRQNKQLLMDPSQASPGTKRRKTKLTAATKEGVDSGANPRLKTNDGTGRGPASAVDGGGGNEEDGDAGEAGEGGAGIGKGDQTERMQTGSGRTKAGASARSGDQPGEGGGDPIASREKSSREKKRPEIYKPKGVVMEISRLVCGWKIEGLRSCNVVNIDVLVPFIDENGLKVLGSDLVVPVRSVGRRKAKAVGFICNYVFSNLRKDDYIRAEISEGVFFYVSCNLVEEYKPEKEGVERRVSFLFGPREPQGSRSTYAQCVNGVPYILSPQVTIGHISKDKREKHSFVNEPTITEEPEPEVYSVTAIPVDGFQLDISNVSFVEATPSGAMEQHSGGSRAKGSKGKGQDMGTRQQNFGQRSRMPGEYEGEDDCDALDGFDADALQGDFGDSSMPQPMHRVVKGDVKSSNIRCLNDVLSCSKPSFGNLQIINEGDQLYRRAYAMSDACDDELYLGRNPISFLTREQVIGLCTQIEAYDMAYNTETHSKLRSSTLVDRETKHRLKSQGRQPRFKQTEARDDEDERRDEDYQPEATAGKHFSNDENDPAHDNQGTVRRVLNRGEVSQFALINPRIGMGYAIVRNHHAKGTFVVIFPQTLVTPNTLNLLSTVIRMNSEKDPFRRLFGPVMASIDAKVGGLITASMTLNEIMDHCDGRHWMVDGNTNIQQYIRAQHSLTDCKFYGLPALCYCDADMFSHKCRTFAAFGEGVEFLKWLSMTHSCNKRMPFLSEFCCMNAPLCELFDGRRAAGTFMPQLCSPESASEAAATTIGVGESGVTFTLQK